jgi:hypothetical protein
MAFIDKKDPVVLNIRLTTCGRELLSTGNLTFKYFAIGDSEINYIFNSETGLDAFNAKILRPVDVNPNIISYVPQNLSGTPFNVIPSIPASTYIVTNTAEEVGFFQPTTGTSTGFTFIVDSNHIKQPDAMIYMSGMTTANNKTIYLKKAPTYGTSGAEPTIDDLLLVKWTLTANTTGYTTSKSYPTPFLIYKIVSITGGTLATNNVIITVDRNLPNFSGFTPTAVAGAMVLYNFINFSGDTIFNMSATDYLDESVIDFFQNSQCPTIIFPYWNMSIIFTEEIAGVQSGNITYGQFNTAPYGGFVSYIQNQAPVLKKLGVIHYTNDSPANVYGEGFYLRTPRLNIPTIMWHKSTGKTLGVILSAFGDVKLLTGATRSLDLQYYDLADPYGNIVGKQFTDLKIFVIEDQELLFAMSYKANRSWTLPDFIANTSTGSGCIPPPEPIIIVTGKTTAEFMTPKEFQKITTGGFDISNFGNITEYGVQYRAIGATGWTKQTVLGTLIVPQYTMVITGLLPNTTYLYKAIFIAGTGTTNGNQLTATTLATPSVQTVVAASVTYNSIIGTGGSSIPTDVWSGATNPPYQYYAMQYRVLGDSTWLFSPLPPNTGPSGGAFSSNITGLAANTTYEYRAWIQVDFVQYNGATQTEHTAFAPAVIPTVTTTTISGIGQISATGGGNVTLDGGASVTSRGVAYSTSLNPTIGGSHTTDSSGLGIFVSSIVGLTPSTLYHVRAYATNSVGTAYGADSAFTTNVLVPTAPTITTSPVSPIGTNTATSGGEVTNEGSSPVTQRGIVWSTISGPTIGFNLGIAVDASGPGVFTSALVGLYTGTGYYVRAYAINSVNISYGNEVFFQTESLPTVSTTAISDWTLTTATTGGNVLNQGIPAVVTARGVVWDISHNPTVVLSTKTVDGSGNGSYSSNITGLIAGTTYYIRAYATNSIGTSYGTEISITPKAITLTISQTSCNTSSFDCNVQGRICYTPALSAGQCVAICAGFAFRTCYCGSGPAAISDVQFCRNSSIFCTICNTNPPNVCQPMCHATITINSGDAICYCNYSTSCHGGCNCFNIVALPNSSSSVGIVPTIGSPSVSTFSIP